MKNLSIALLLLSVIACHSEEVQFDSLGTKFQRTVNAMKALTDSLEIPEHLKEINARKQEGDFKVQDYFTALRHLSMQEGYVLDYIYDYGFMSGSPILYARRIDQVPYQTVDEFEDAMERMDEIDSLGKKFEAQQRYLNHVVIDRSEEGFLEILALYLSGGQFYLYGHDNYDDIRIISDKSALDELFDNKLFHGLDLMLPKKLRLEADRIDYNPQIQIGEKETVVSVVIFTKWGGFARWKFVLSTSFPHTIKKKASQKLANYDCGLMF